MNCKYCDHDKEICGDKFEDYTCTREKGHTEEHAACGMMEEGTYSKHPILSWYHIDKKGGGQ